MEIFYSMLPFGKNDVKQEMVVVHAMAEHIRDSDGVYTARDYLEKLKLSAHTLVTPYGDLFICRHDEQSAYHARGYNSVSLGIEVLLPGVHDYSSFLKGISEPDWVSEDQLTAAVYQVKQWINIFQIPLHKVSRHCDISPGRKVDPGDGFPWQEFKKRLVS